MDLGSRYPTRFLREYVKWKVKSDPIYAVVPTHLPPAAPLLDLGCGIGILELYLRTQGCTGSITGIDHDEKKIAIARSVTSGMPDFTFVIGDARSPLPGMSNVVMFDLLHYFDDSDQRAILSHIADALPADGVAIIREGLRERNMRYWLTYWGEVFARLNGWMKAARLNFPRREVFDRAFPPPDFSIDASRSSGWFPTNNYVFVVRRVRGNAVASAPAHDSHARIAPDLAGHRNR